MPYICFDTFFGILTHVGHVFGAPKVQKNAILGKYKMVTSVYIVHLRKKFIKQKSLVLMSYTFSEPKFLTSDKNLIYVFGQKTYTKKISIFKMTAAKLQEIFWTFFQYHLQVYIQGHTW